MFGGIRFRLRSLFLRRRLEREMREEMELHLLRSTERLISRGMSPGAARAAALREFGNVGWLEERGRDAWGGAWLEGLAKDLRFAVRQLARAPLTSVVMILVLALGIGANSALFTFLRSVATQPTPGIPRDDRVVRIRGTVDNPIAGGRARRLISHAELGAYGARDELFEGVAGWTTEQVPIDLGPDIEGLLGRASFVTEGFFDVLGVRPVVGAGLSAGDGVVDANVAVIGHEAWSEWLGRSPDAVGGTIRVNGTPVRIVGVAPPRFTGATGSGGRADLDLWLPLEARATLLAAAAPTGVDPDSAHFGAVARLREGVSVEAATAAVTAIARPFVARIDDERRRQSASADVAPLLATNETPGRTRDLTADYALLLGPAAVLILLVTCANVSALLVGLAARRRQEIAVRLSIGAGRRRVVRQLLTEGVLLAVLGSAAGLGLIASLVALLGARIEDVQLVTDWSSVAFTVGLAVTTGVLFALAPALHGTRIAVAEVLKDSTSLASPRSRLQRSLVVAQIGLTQPLLVVVGAVVLTVLSAFRGAPRTDHWDQVVTMDFAIVGDFREARDAEPLLVERVASLPGVLGATPRGTGYAPSVLAVHPDDRTGASELEGGFRAALERAAPGHFTVLGIPILRGRAFRPGDQGAVPEPVVIASDLAEMLWGDADPIGRRLVDARVGSRDEPEKVVIGVVDAEVAGVSDDVSRMRVYVDRPTAGRGLLVRVDGPAAARIPELRAVVNAESPHIAVARIGSMADEVREMRRFMLRVGGGAISGGLLALLLASIGLYATIALAVTQRTREIGVRMALGAGRRRIIAGFLRRGLEMSGMGVLAGLPLSLVALRIAGAQVWVTGPRVLAVGIAVVVPVVIVSALATLIPAGRATRVDATTALRGP